VLQYIALLVAAVGNNVFTISTGKNYPVPETITLQLTDTEKCAALIALTDCDLSSHIPDIITTGLSSMS